MAKPKVLLIVNPKSGMGKVRNHLLDIVDIMVKEGCDVVVYTTQTKEDARRKVMESGEEYDRIICAGGDGTLDEVVTGLCVAELEVPIGYIPAGSTNDFANSLGIPMDMGKAAKITMGKEKKLFDVGKFNEDFFVYIAAFGLFTEVSYETPQELKNVLGHLAYLLSAPKSLESIPNYRLHIESGDKVIDDTFIYGMVTNSISVAGIRGMTGRNVKLDDGKFEVLLIKTPTNAIELGEILKYLTGVITKSENVYYFKCKQIQICSTEEIPWTLDGEYGGKHTIVEIQNQRKRMQIFI